MGTKKKINPFDAQRRVKERMIAKGYKFEYGVTDSIYKCRVIRPDGSSVIVNVASNEDALLPEDKHIGELMKPFWDSIDEHILDTPSYKDEEGEL